MVGQIRVEVILENVLPPVPAAHHVINRPRKFHPHLSRHRARFALGAPEMQEKKD